ncbi:MAG: transcriptional repressor [Geminicoccaceae bacterium]|nr:MAG: transcriptional repressor [Geminicoccaceae bacterium]
MEAEAANIVDRAARICARRGERFTPLRRRILELIAAAGRPVGAYELKDQLGAERGPVAPPTVYRTLDFLDGQGLIHRIHSKNAYVVCAQAEAAHSAELLICRACGRVAELPCKALEQHLIDHAATLGFAVEAVCVEVAGICSDCRDKAATAA